MANNDGTEAYRLAMEDQFSQAIHEFFSYTGKGCLDATEVLESVKEILDL